MKFELKRLPTQPKTLLDGPIPERWSWDATVQGDVVATAPGSYPSEAEARTSIAAARKAMVGAKFAKVVPADGD